MSGHLSGAVERVKPVEGESACDGCWSRFGQVDARRSASRPAARRSKLFSSFSLDTNNPILPTWTAQPLQLCLRASSSSSSSVSQHRCLPKERFPSVSRLKRCQTYHNSRSRLHRHNQHTKLQLLCRTPLRQLRSQHLKLSRVPPRRSRLLLHHRSRLCPSLGRAQPKG